MNLLSKQVNFRTRFFFTYLIYYLCKNLCLSSKNNAVQTLNKHNILFYTKIQEFYNPQFN